MRVVSFTLRLFLTRSEWSSCLEVASLQHTLWLLRFVDFLPLSFGARFLYFPTYVREESCGCCVVQRGHLSSPN